MRTSFQICILSLVALIIGVAAPRVNAQCTGDVIPSGIIDGVDLAQMLSSWGPCTNCPADIDGDGAVTGIDLGQLLAGWGPCPPFIASVAPSQGTIVGGTPITISGAYFTGATSVTIGGSPAINMVVVSSTTITAVTPAHAAGSVSITVTTPVHTTPLKNVYSYASASVLSIVPNAGALGGGSAVTITGNYFTGATSVTIGGAHATNVVVVSPTTITIVTPPGLVGLADVVVMTPTGVAIGAEAFTYLETAVPAWATLLQAQPDPSEVTGEAFRARIAATGLAWRVRDNASNIEMLLVPPGTFIMGASLGDAEASADESPAHQVTLTHAFYLGRTEVTQATWVAEMGSNPSWFPNNPNRPVESVVWNKIQPFCIQNGLRLPTEAEWEYACRAGSTEPRYGPVGDVAWYSGNSGQTAVVATKLPNALGFFDMLGNVRELVSDGYGPYAPGSVIDPTGPTTGTYNSHRGGAFGDAALKSRASMRRGTGPDYANDSHFGFRVAKSP